MSGRVVRGAVVATAALSLVLSQAGASATAVASQRTASGPAAGGARTNGPAISLDQVTAHDGRFYQGTTPVVLKGFNVWVGGATQNLYDKLAGWRVNLLRLHLIWSKLEPSAPTKVGSTWTHNYDPVYVQDILDAVTYAENSGIQVLFEGTVCNANDASQSCPFFGYPDWLFTAPYNSHGITYPQTEQGQTDGITNLWTDDLQKQFMTDFWTYIAGLMRTKTGIVGYEVMNEPKVGSYAQDGSSTQMVLDFEVQMGTAIRTIDPSRIIVYMSRDGYGVGIPMASLTGVTALGNGAFDIHDYIGARWGNGFANNPAKTEYLEKTEGFFMTTTTQPTTPFLGTMDNLNRWLTTIQTPLSAAGIPLLVGELGTEADDLGVYTFFGMNTTALNAMGLSWCGWYSGPLGVTDGSGNLYPWSNLLLDAL